jgi:hypothetical protein
MWRSVPLLGLLTTLSPTLGRVLRAQIPILSDSAARDVLAEARTIRCAFDSGVGFEYGTTTRPNTIPLLRPQPLKPGSYDNPQVIDQIDRQRGTARLILSAGAVTVHVLSGPAPERDIRYSPLVDGNSVSLLWLAVNNPVVITVFPNRAPNSVTELVAVMTRHMEWFGGLSISQHYGRCTVLFG